ncbi:amidohydrolase family protein [Edaphocola flava]|uniref:amidohydrolase family protein n=1 Tax=Edaphocola flava TaxID=2499629 RepID=UPI00100AE28B|nr:amidohydrolase family protein [Edaphocola flava]
MNYTAKQIEFIEQARESISNESHSRLSPITQEALQRNNFVFDAHCHVFDSKCINVKYLILRMIAGVPEMLKPILYKILTGNTMGEELKIVAKEELVESIYDEFDFLSNTKDVTSFIEEMEINLDSVELEMNTANKIGLSKLGVGEFLKRYRYILSLLKSAKMEDVYKSFRDKYGVHGIVSEMNEKEYELITIILGMDLNIAWDDSIEKSQQEQIRELGLLASKYPVLPFLPLDPRRVGTENDLYETFLNAFSTDHPSFFGVKCYPALGYLPTDSRLKPIFQICAEKNIPVMTHCGGESVSTFINPILVDRNGVEEQINLNSRKARARFLNEPREWIDVLKIFPELRLCFGHFGSGKAWSEPNSIYFKRVQIILDLMKEYRNVYADFSYNIESSIATSNFITKLTQLNSDGDLMRTKTMFGTDFWVVLPMSDLNLDQRMFLDKLGELKDNLLRINVLSYLNL